MKPLIINGNGRLHRWVRWGNPKNKNQMSTVNNLCDYGKLMLHALWYTAKRVLPWLLVIAVMFSFSLPLGGTVNNEFFEWSSGYAWIDCIALGAVGFVLWAMFFVIILICLVCVGWVLKQIEEAWTSWRISVWVRKQEKLEQKMAKDSTIIVSAFSAWLNKFCAPVEIKHERKE